MFGLSFTQARELSAMISNSDLYVIIEIRKKVTHKDFEDFLNSFLKDTKTKASNPKIWNNGNNQSKV